VKVSEVSWQNRTHFFAVCARIMRRILTDFARSLRYLKRGGNAARIPFDEALFAGREAPADIVVLDETVNRDWKLSKAWLLHELIRGKHDGS
jgi:RNA polymerase sigma-70 factor, ECF subfamily